MDRACMLVMSLAMACSSGPGTEVGAVGTPDPEPLVVEPYFNEFSLDLDTADEPPDVPTGVIPTTVTFIMPGNTMFTVPDDVTAIHARVEGAGGGGSDGLSASPGGAGSLIEVDLEVTPGEVFVLVIGGGGWGAGCSATSPGAGGGGLSGMFTEEIEPLVIAAGGGGASQPSAGCSAGTECTTVAYGVGADGAGAGGAGDATVEDGWAGGGPPLFLGGRVAGAGNCETRAGGGGHGGGGGGGGSVLFVSGGGGGGGGYPGGPGGDIDNGGHGGFDLVDERAVVLLQDEGSGGGSPGVDGVDGSIQITY